MSVDLGAIIIRHKSSTKAPALLAVAAILVVVIVDVDLIVDPRR